MRIRYDVKCIDARSDEAKAKDLANWMDEFFPGKFGRRMSREFLHNSFFDAYRSVERFRGETKFRKRLIAYCREYGLKFQSEFIGGKEFITIREK